jgi:WD40 repeat protein
MITLENPDASKELIRYDYARDAITFQQSWSESTVIAIAPNNDYVCTARERSTHGVSNLQFLDPLRTCSDNRALRTYGIDTALPHNHVISLTSLAWNATGTTLVGGSSVGTLFTWDADDLTE